MLYGKSVLASPACKLWAMSIIYRVIFVICSFPYVQRAGAVVKVRNKEFERTCSNVPSDINNLRKAM